MNVPTDAQPSKLGSIKDIEQRIDTLTTRFAKSPLKRDHVGYFEHVAALNDALHALVYRFFDQANKTDPVFRAFTEIKFVNHPQRRFAFMTTGSDGRSEKGSMSPVELVIGGDCAITTRCLQRMLSWKVAEISNANLISPRINWMSTDKSYLGLPELKVVSDFRVQPFNPNSHPLVSPMRVFDAAVLFGDNTILDNIRARLFDEIQNPISHQRIHKHLKDKVGDFRKICSTGANKLHGVVQTHFEMLSDEGAMFFNNATNLGFKMGPLRLIQFRIALDYVQFLKNSTSPDEARAFIAGVLNASPSIPGRLNFLTQQNYTRVNIPELQELADHYEFFLWTYHCSQNVYHSAKTEKITAKEIGTTKNEIEHRIARVLDLTRDPLIVP